MSQTAQITTNPTATTSITVTNPVLIPKLTFMAVSPTAKATSATTAATLTAASNPLLIPKLRRFLIISALLLSESLTAYAKQNAPLLLVVLDVFGAGAEWIGCLRVGLLTKLSTRTRT